MKDPAIDPVRNPPRVPGPPDAEDLRGTILRALAPLATAIVEVGLDTEVELAGSHFRFSRSDGTSDDRAAFEHYALFDLSDAEHTMDVQRRLDERMRALADAAPALFFVKDPRDLRFDYWSRRLGEATGIEGSEIEGRAGDLLFPKEDLVKYQACDRHAVTSKVVVAVEERIAGRRASMWSYTRKIPIVDARGNVTRILGLVEDRTGNRRREGARDELYDELVTTLKEREMLLSTVAHDLANPLAALSLSTEVMMKMLAAAGSSNDLSSLQRLTTRISDAATRMHGLVADLTARNHLASGALATTKHDAGELAREAHDLMAPLAAERGVDLRLQDPGLPLVVTCDRERILRVLSNLLGNAVKFSRAGGVVVLETAEASNAARFSVTDSGPGLAPDQIAHVFEAYWQAGEHRHQGSGLGLWIAKQIVDRHGGCIGVESEAGRGSAFFFTLPLSL